MLTKTYFPRRQAALADVTGLTGVTGESGRIQKRGFKSAITKRILTLSF